MKVKVNMSNPSRSDSETVSANETAIHQNEEKNDYQKSIVGNESEVEGQELPLNQWIEAKTLRDKIRELHESRANRIDELSEWYDAINRLISRQNTSEMEVLLKMEGFVKAWMEFVDVHEKFLALSGKKGDKDNACETYEQQKTRKLHLDTMVTEWRNKLNLSQGNLGDIQSQRASRSSRSKSSGVTEASSRLSRQSKKTEKMTLAQLKLEQLKIRQQFELKEQEIKRQKKVHGGRNGGRENNGIISYCIGGE